MLGWDGPRDISEGQILISCHEIYLTKGKIQIHNEKDDGTFEVNIFSKRQSLMVTKVDTFNWESTDFRCSHRGISDWNQKVIWL